MKTNLHICLALALASACVAADQFEIKSSASAERAAAIKRDEILAEIKNQKGHKWAGNYYAGDGLGENTSLVLAPKSGYVFEWRGCMGLYDRNFGAATWTNDRVRLSFTFQNKRDGFQGIAPELIPISWESREYLVAADDIVGFCNDINEGREPRNEIYGSYLLRQGDEKKEVKGLPEVPEQYRQYLLAKPVKATIVSVGAYTTRPSVADWKFKDTPVTIDAGMKQGLLVGMELLVTQPENIVESVKITKVEDARAEAVMVQAGEEEPGPKAGWRLSTRAPWNVDTAK